ncbi:MOSC domain-containing protein [Dactylosporangium matsuzakiense]|uniref:Molybdenum cofactor biosynthesis protein n=1 Tax=Dactylosporangium matsuzakiense TaxID=53360 RepID=A0A9W6KJL7_9ACTN|nr:MOSC N-terminal beta barrel domain-containing protein [Dactylosporangium matsuzakiense]GLL00714.1 molybdenum cofactor biosynthesis protein [Dactylosporangium matsuzakiense]
MTWDARNVRLSYLATYPIKSCYRVEADTAEVEPWGLAGDRRWIVVDEAAKLMTQRHWPALGRIRPRYTGSGLVLEAAGLEPVDVPYPVVGRGEGEVEHFREWIAATSAGDVADAWVSRVLGRPGRLFHLDDPTRRAVDPEYGTAGDRVSFADGYPVLLANDASLRAVNDWLAEDGDEPVTMTRFRPNVVVSGAPAWAEDDWIGRRVVIGDVTFRVPKHCERCVLTTVDPETGEKGRQPLRVLGKHRRFASGLLFAVNLIPDGPGKIAIGDEVTIL